MSRGKSKSNNAVPAFYVGEHVLLSGTGTRWGGGSFRATIEDVRADDDTVKVHHGSNPQVQALLALLSFCPVAAS